MSIGSVGDFSFEEVNESPAPKTLQRAQALVEQAEIDLDGVKAEARADKNSAKLKLKACRAEKKVLSAKLKAKTVELDNMAVERETLRAELKALKEREENSKLKLEIAEPILDLFKTTTDRSYGSKGFPIKVYGAQVDNIIIEMLANGHAGTAVHQFLTTLAETVVIGVLEQEDGQPRSVPSLSYINSLRSTFQVLNKKRIESFVSNATRVTLSADDSPSLEGRPLSSMGMYNERGEFICIGITENEAKTGVGLAQNMGVWSKLRESVKK